MNSEFYGRYKPQFNKDPDEYWMTFEDFRCNFGGLIICSDSAPYRTEGMNIDRCYRRLSDEEIKPTQKTVTVFQERKPVGKRQARYSVPAHYLKSKRSSIPEVHEIEYSHRHRESVPRQFLAVKCASKTGQEIQVKETGKTLKIDNTYRKAHRKYTSSHTKWNLESNESNHTSGYRRIRHEKYSQLEAVPATRRKESKIPSVSYNQSDVKIKNDDETGASQGRSGSLTSNCSLLSQCPSTFSASDITVHFQNSCVLSRDDSLKRPRSAPGNGSSSGRRTSSGSLPNVTVSNFLATTSDHFQSHGSWKQVIDYKGCWESKFSLLSPELFN